MNAALPLKYVVVLAAGYQFAHIVHRVRHHVYEWKRERTPCETCGHPRSDHPWAGELLGWTCQHPDETTVPGWCSCIGFKRPEGAVA